MSVIHVDVVSATEEIYSGDANCVFAPATMGEIGVYPQHVPLISTLKPGEVRVETENGMESIFVSGGIIEVQPDTVTIFLIQLFVPMTSTSQKPLKRNSVLKKQCLMLNQTKMSPQPKQH